ncbi:MAG: D-alanyl-D-alanine carboxypeptidase family protein, partial [Oscillospiraceae bacterium]
MGGSQIWLEPGELFTLDELIKAICISSANDAAVAVCEYVGGSEGVFLQMMNDRATELGMKNTHFCNACGLDEEGHYSSARDVAIMSRELLRHPKILEYSGIWMDSLRGGLTQLTNTNKLLKRYSGITGLKTGTTNKAGVCISATATREGMGLIAVVLGSVNSEDRFLSATTLLDYGFASYEIVPFPTVENLPKTIPIKHGVEKETTISANLPKKLFVNKGEGKNITAEFCLPDSLTAPIKKGDGIAKIALKQEKNTIGEYAITAEKEVNEMNFNAAFKLLTKELFTL